eukprot:6203427-Pleurochrysis_carterae.AAC.1
MASPAAAQEFELLTRPPSPNRATRVADSTPTEGTRPASRPRQELARQPFSRLCRGEGRTAWLNVGTWPTLVGLKKPLLTGDGQARSNAPPAVPPTPHTHEGGCATGDRQDPTLRPSLNQPAGMQAEGGASCAGSGQLRLICWAHCWCCAAWMPPRASAFDTEALYATVWSMHY